MRNAKTGASKATPPGPSGLAGHTPGCSFRRQKSNGTRLSFSLSIHDIGSFRQKVQGEKLAFEKLLL